MWGSAARGTYEGRWVQIGGGRERALLTILVLQRSCHYEADLDRRDRACSTLVRCCGATGGRLRRQRLAPAPTRSVGAHGNGAQMAVQGVPVGGARGRGGAGRGGPPAGRGDTPPPAPPPPVPNQDVAQVGTAWPGGPVDPDGAVHAAGAAEWSITPVDNGGGYPGSPYFKITIRAPSVRSPQPRMRSSPSSPRSLADPINSGIDRAGRWDVSAHVESGRTRKTAGVSGNRQQQADARRVQGGSDRQ